MHHLKSLRVFIPALCLALPLGAQQTTKIDFNAFASPTTTEYQAAIGAPVSSGGMDFIASSGLNANNRNALGTWGTGDAGSLNRPTNLGSSTTMFVSSLGGQVNMVRTGTDYVNDPVYQPFSLFSMDVGHLYSTEYSSIGLQPFTLTFTGWGAAGNAFTQSFFIDVPTLVNGFRTPVLQTIYFDDRFRDLEEVAWLQASGSGTAHQFTNVVVTTPEPSSLALLGTGLTGVLGFVGRRRRRTTTA